MEFNFHSRQWRVDAGGGQGGDSRVHRRIVKTDGGIALVGAGGKITNRRDGRKSQRTDPRRADGNSRGEGEWSRAGQQHSRQEKGSLPFHAAFIWRSSSPGFRDHLPLGVRRQAD
jgi:hypothetical protein